MGKMEKFFTTFLSKYHQYIIIVTLLICNIIFITHNLDDENLSIIEIDFALHTHEKASLWHVFTGSLDQTSKHHLPVYFMLQKILLSMLGFSKLALYILPIISSCIIVITIFLLSNKLYSPLIARVTTLLFIFSLMNFHYSRDVEENMFFAAIFIISLYALYLTLENINNNKFKKSFIFFCISYFLCLWTHNLGLYVFIGYILFIILLYLFKRKNFKKKYWSIAIAILFIGLTALPLYIKNSIHYVEHIDFVIFNIEQPIMNILSPLITNTKLLLLRGGLFINKNEQQYLLIYILFLIFILLGIKQIINKTHQIIKNHNIKHFYILYLIALFFSLTAISYINPYTSWAHHTRAYVLISFFLLIGSILHICVRITPSKLVYHTKIIILIATTYIIILTFVQLPDIEDIEWHGSHDVALDASSKILDYHNNNILYLATECKSSEVNLAFREVSFYEPIRFKQTECYQIINEYFMNKTMTINNEKYSHILFTSDTDITQSPSKEIIILLNNSYKFISSLNKDNYWIFIYTTSSN